jgi:hypothetical protein
LNRKEPAERRELYMDSRVQLFLGKFLNGELEHLYPVLDEKIGYRYPGAEIFVDRPEEAEAFLKSLKDLNLLKEEICGFLMCCPECSSCNIDQVLPKADVHENRVIRGEKTSGEAEISEDAMSGGVVWECRNCGTIIQKGALSARPVFSYKFSEEGIGEISDRLAIKPLLEFLRERGYDTESPGFMTGESEVEHVFDITAWGDDKNEMILALDFEVSEEPVGEDRVISMFAKVFDTNPPRSVLVAFPGLTRKARRLAEQYDIDVVETHDLGTLWKDLLKVIPPVDEFRFETLDVMTLLSLPDHLRKTASVVCERGKTTADEIAGMTKRARAVESGYLNQLVRMGYLKKERKGRQVLFSVIS